MQTPATAFGCDVLPASRCLTARDRGGLAFPWLPSGRGPQVDQIYFHTFKVAEILRRRRQVVRTGNRHNQAVDRVQIAARQCAEGLRRGRRPGLPHGQRSARGPRRRSLHSLDVRQQPVLETERQCLHRFVCCLDCRGSKPRELTEGRKLNRRVAQPPRSAWACVCEFG